MLTAVIRSKTMVGLLLTYVLAAILVGSVWFLEGDNTSISELLSTHWAFGWSETNQTAIAWLGVGLLAGSAVFSRIRFREIKETLAGQNLSMLAFVSIISAQTSTLFGRPDIMIATMVLIAVFMFIFFTYKKDSALSEIFHVGLGIGLASLFVGQSIILVLVVGFSLLMLRTGSMKEGVVFLLGLGMTAIFVFLVVIWAEMPILSFKRVIQSAWLAQVSISGLTAGHIILFALIGLSLSVALSNITAGTVHQRNITMVNLGWMAGIAIMSIILGVDWQAGLVLAAFPTSNLLAQFVESIRRWWLADFLVLLLIAAPVFSILWPF